MFLPYKFIHKAQYTEMLNFTWSEKNGQLWTWISIARTNYSPSIYGTITATRTTKKNKIWEVKKRFTRENKNKQSKTRFSAFFFIKCPIIKINSSSKQYPDVFVSFVQDTINQFSRILWTCWNWVGFGISLLPETAILLEFEPVAAMVTAFAYNALVCISLGSRMLAGQIHRSLSFAEDQPF